MRGCGKLRPLPKLERAGLRDDAVPSAFGKCHDFFLFGFHHPAGLFKGDDECLRFVECELRGDGNHDGGAIGGNIEYAAIDG